MPLRCSVVLQHSWNAYCKVKAEFTLLHVSMGVHVDLHVLGCHLPALIPVIYMYFITCNWSMNYLLAVLRGAGFLQPCTQALPHMRERPPGIKPIYIALLMLVFNTVCTCENVCVCVTSSNSSINSLYAGQHCVRLTVSTNRETYSTHSVINFYIIPTCTCTMSCISEVIELCHNASCLSRALT